MSHSCDKYICSTGLLARSRQGLERAKYERIHTQSWECLSIPKHTFIIAKLLYLSTIKNNKAQ